MELVCIVCPNSCRLTVSQNGGKLDVQGAKCKRGLKFAEDETVSPARTVCSSVKTTVKDIPVVSVKTSGEIPKSKIFELMKVLSQFVLNKSVPIGTVVISNVLNTGVNIITTSEMQGFTKED